jgi:hypothetical protein
MVIVKTFLHVLPRGGGGREHASGDSLQACCGTSQVRGFPGTNSVLVACLRINHQAMERALGGKFLPSELHSPSFGVGHSGGPGGGSQLLSFLGLSLSNRGLPCWKGPRMSGSTKE